MIAHLLIIGGILALAVCSLSLLALHLLPTGVHPTRDTMTAYVASRFGDLYVIQTFACGVCALCLLAALTLLHAPLLYYTPVHFLTPVWLGDPFLLGYLGFARILRALFLFHPHDEQNSITPEAIRVFPAAIAIAILGASLSHLLFPSYMDRLYKDRLDRDRLDRDRLDRDRREDKQLQSRVRRAFAHPLWTLIDFPVMAATTALLTGPMLSFRLWHGPAAFLMLAAALTSLAVVIMFIVSMRATWSRYFGLVERAIYAGFLLWLWLVFVPLAGAGI